MQLSSFARWQGGPPLALVVDRDGDTRRLYSDYLQLAGCGVEEAADGREALAKALSGSPDIVITETRLPGISGFELCRLLRADVAAQSIKVVFVTADAFARDVNRARSAGAAAVLVKPCLPERLLLEVQRVVAESRILRARADAVRNAAQDAIQRSSGLVENAMAVARRPLSRAMSRFQTSTPAQPPPALVCPSCGDALHYRHSNVGGVSPRQAEQWDYFNCPGGCGIFQYRQRTRKLRRVV
jgi:CheY-like chemotaxis protein